MSATRPHRFFDPDDSMEDDGGYYLPKEISSAMKSLNSHANMSLTFNQWELGGNQTLAVPASITAGIESEKVLDGLFEDFLVTMESRASRQIFEILSDLIQTCSDTLDRVRDMQRKAGKRCNYVKDILFLQSERNTWQLIYCLYQNRVNKQLFPESTVNIESTYSHLSEKDIATLLYRKDNSIYECQLVIDWLEKASYEQIEVDAPRPEYFTDRTVAWENTLHQLQNETTRIPYSSSRPIVTQLDPDAPSREGLPLHDIDVVDDQRLIRHVFVEIRNGRLEAAQDLYEHCGQPWRAAELEGWRLFHDPNYSGQASEGSEKLPAEGNPMRDVWKTCAWRMSSDKTMSACERGVYGALCGNSAAVVPLCRTWCDHLWARLRAAVDVRVEQEVRERMTRHFEDMPEDYWRNNLSLDDIFSELSSCSDEAVRDESTEPGTVVLQMLILDDVPRLMREMHGWLEEWTSPHFVRFLAHIVLVLRRLGASKLDDVGNEVIQAYVKILISQGNPRHVAYYVSALPPPEQVHWYAVFLGNVTEREARTKCLEVAEKVGLDVEAITKTVVENVRNKAVEHDFPDLKADLTAEDLEKVSALDWVVYYPSQRAEALWQSNALIRHFLAVGKLEAAGKALNKIPGDTIEVISKQYACNFPGADLEFGNTSMPPRIASSIREHLCYRAYLDAQVSFTDWFKYFHNAKPVAPVKPTGAGVTFTNRVAYDHHKKDYEIELERWKSAMTMQTQMAKQRLYNVLLFPDGGWLADTQPAEEQPATAEEQGRAQQLSSLRGLCLPSVVLLLQSVASSAGDHDECMRLADVVADEKYQIYKVYSKQKLRDLLQKLAQSAIPLLNQKKDAWGYSM